MTSLLETSTLLAHAGGWDEALIFLAPVIVYLVIRRMGRQEPPDDDLTQPDGTSPPAAETDDEAT